LVEAAPISAALDDYLKDMIHAVYAAVNVALPHAQDEDPTIVDNAIENCEEILGVVMDGKVDDWLN
jgi:hypothetical protein